MRQDGPKRDMLLDDLITTGAARERVFVDYHQQLEQLGGFTKQDIGKVTSSLTGQATEKKIKNEEGREDHSSGTQERSITFESAPEDISSGQFD